MVGSGLAQPQERITSQYTAPFHGKGVWQVVDGQGRVVGDVIGFSEFDGSATVAFWHQPTRSAYTLSFTRDYIYSGPNGVYYDEPDCKGTPITIWNEYERDNALHKPAAIGGPYQTIYIPVPGAAPHPIWPKSNWRPIEGDCTNLDWEEPDEPHTPVILMMPIGNFADYFQSPYSVR
jgi:hypothetical protein